ISSSLCTSMVGGRPARGRSVRPAMPDRVKRWRQVITVWREQPSSSAISLLATPSAARVMIRARWASPHESEGERSQVCSSASCLGEAASAAAALGMADSLPRPQESSNHFANATLGPHPYQAYSRDAFKQLEA